MSASPTAGTFIGVCSWQRHFHHCTFNATLLQTLALAFPGTRLRYHADETQKPHLKEVLDMTLPDISGRLDFVPMRLGRARTLRGNVSRFTAMLHFIRMMRDPRLVCFVFADLGAPLLSLLKRLMRLAGVSVPVIVVAHGLFEPLGWRTGTRLRDIAPLRTPSPRSLRIVVLGEHIRKALLPFDPWHQHDVRVLPHPVLHLRHPPVENEKQSGCRFVFPGVPDKGLGRYASMAAKVRTACPEARFASAGFAETREEREAARASLESVADAPLPVPRYLEEIGRATHGVWFTVHEPDPYRFRTSGTIPDLIACGKPGIFLRNEMVEDYFARFGSIGRMCSTWKDLEDCLEATAREFPSAEFASEQACVARVREALSPEGLAPLLRHIISTDKPA